MTDIRFYHLQSQPLERALPAILMKILGTGQKAVVRFASDSDVRHYNDHLWTFHPDSFLPHGQAQDGRAESQPIYLTSGADNPNGAQVLVLCGMTAAPDNLADFALCCDFLDGRDEGAVAAGRTRWKHYKDSGHTVTYWQQTDSGGWEQKA